MLVLEVVLAVAALMALGWVVSACVCGCRNNHQKASTQNSQRSLPEIPQPVGRHDSADTASDLIYATVNIDGGAAKTEPTPSTSRDHSYEHAYAKVQKESHIHIEKPPEQAASNVPDISIIEPEIPSQAALESVVISAGVAISGQLPSSQELPYITPPSPHPPPPDIHPPQVPLQPQHFSGDSTDSTKGYTSISVREPLSNIRAILTQNNKTQQHYATVSDDSDEMYAAIEEPNGSAGGSDTYAQIAPQAVEPRPQEQRPQEPRPPPESRPSGAELRQSQERELAPRNTLMPSDAGSRRSAPPEASVVASNHSRQASASSCSNSVGTLGSPKPEKRQANSPLPPPPAAPPEAKPERRKHESPLTHTAISRQQRISSTGDLQFGHDKHRRSLNEKHQRNNSCVSSSDFYGCNYPVEKHRFSSGDIIRPLVAKELNFDIDKQPENKKPLDNLYNSIEGPSCSDYSSAEANVSLTSDRVTESPSRNLEEMYAKVMKKTKSKLHGEELKPARKVVYANENPIEGNADHNLHRFSNDDPGYETIDRKRSVNHGYETISEKVRKNSQNQDPGYETVRDISKGLNANFSNNNLLSKLNHLPLDSGPNSILSSDPGYEHIAKSNNCPSDSDPNYEVLRNEPPTPPYATIAPNYNIQPTYSVINKNRSNNNDEAIVEPNYESMPHDAIYTTGSESDPNYESVRPKDPNYESLRLKSKDPNYESVRSNPGRSKHPPYESVKSKDPNYESVKYMDMKEPPYASVAGEDDSKGLHRSDSAAGYERIKPITKTSINGEGATVDDYFHV